MLRNVFSRILCDSRLESAKSRNCMRFRRSKWRNNYYSKSLRLDTGKDRCRDTWKVLIFPHSLPLCIQPFLSPSPAYLQWPQACHQMPSCNPQRQQLFIYFSISSPFTVSLKQLDVPGFSDFLASTDLSTHASVSKGLVNDFSNLPASPSIPLLPQLLPQLCMI